MLYYFYTFSNFYATFHAILRPIFALFWRESPRTANHVAESGGFDAPTAPLFRDVMVPTPPFLLSGYPPSPARPSAHPCSGTSPLQLWYPSFLRWYLTYFWGVQCWYPPYCAGTSLFHRGTLLFNAGTSLFNAGTCPSAVPGNRTATARPGISTLPSSSTPPSTSTSIP